MSEETDDEEFIKEQLFVCNPTTKQIDGIKLLIASNISFHQVMKFWSSPRFRAALNIDVEDVLIVCQDLLSKFSLTESSSQLRAIHGYDFCSGHGGGDRCKHDDCNLGAIKGTKFCSGHGGGHRCQHDGCDKGARGKTQFCIGHGGGKKCKFDNCTTAAQIGWLCDKHGGKRLKK